MKTLDHAAEITRLEAERDALDQQWRQVRHSGAQTLEEGRARDIELADVEVQYRETELALARLTLGGREQRLAAIDDVDPEATAQAESEYLAAKTLYDELMTQQRAVHSRRRDAQADVKAARQALVEAEHALQQRREKLADLEARPLRGLAPSGVTWIGDGRT